MCLYPGTHTDERKFFEYGMGTQMMMASTSSQAKQLLLDRARRLLADSDMEALKDKLKMVCGQADCLIVS